MLPTLTKFLAKLDDIGILAGERAQGYQASEQQLSAQLLQALQTLQSRTALYAPAASAALDLDDAFFGFSSLLMLATLLLALMNGAEVANYGGYVLREHYFAMFLAQLAGGRHPRIRARA